MGYKTADGVQFRGWRRPETWRIRRPRFEQYREAWHLFQQPQPSADHPLLKNCHPERSEGPADASAVPPAPETPMERMMTQWGFASRASKKIGQTGCKNAFVDRPRRPQGLKPAFLAAFGGTAEAVPFPKSILETSIRLQ